LIAILAIALGISTSSILFKLYLLSTSRFDTLARGGDMVVAGKAGTLDILLGSLNLEGDYPAFIPRKLADPLRSNYQIQFQDGAAAGASAVQSVIPFLYYARLNDFRGIGTDDNFLNRPAGRDPISLKEGHWFSAPGEIVLGATVAEKEGLRLGDSAVLQSWSGDASRTTFSAKVVGVLNPTRTAWDRAFYAPLPEAQAAINGDVIQQRSIWQRDVVNYLLVYVANDQFGSVESLINQRSVGETVRVAHELERLKEVTEQVKRSGF